MVHILVSLLLICKKNLFWSRTTIMINPRAPRSVAVAQEVMWLSLDISPLCKMSTIARESGEAGW